MDTFPLPALCNLARLDRKGVEPEATPRTARHLFGVGGALFVVIGEHDHAERPEATDLRPQLMSALGTQGQHLLMFARQRLGVLDSKVQSPYTLRAILIQPPLTGIKGAVTFRTGGVTGVRAIPTFWNLP